MMTLARGMDVPGEAMDEWAVDIGSPPTAPETDKVGSLWVPASGDGLLGVVVDVCGEGEPGVFLDGFNIALLR